MTERTDPATGIAELHRRALDDVRAYVAAIGDDQWMLPTPCEGWSVHELVNHIVAGNLWAAELGSGRTIADVGSSLDGDVIGSHPVDAYDRSAAMAAAAFEAAGALEAPCAVSYGPVPGSVYAGHRFIDVLIHGWDLAVATGQRTDIDPQLIDACWEVLRPQLAPLQASGAFGVARPDDPGDDPQARLLAALGRSA